MKRKNPSRRAALDSSGLEKIPLRAVAARMTQPSPDCCSPHERSSHQRRYESKPRPVFAFARPVSHRGCSLHYRQSLDQNLREQISVPSAS